MTTYIVRLACGHSTVTQKPARKGDWISCWALMHPDKGCQAQRKVVSAEPSSEESTS